MKNNLFIFNESTTGLHIDDINRLITIFNQLVVNENTVINIEHHLDVIKCADYIIDLGPEGGEFGGEIVTQGTPEQVSKINKSLTDQYLSANLVKNKRLI